MTRGLFYVPTSQIGKVSKEVNKKQDATKKLLELLRVQRPYKTFLESAKKQKRLLE